MQTVVIAIGGNAILPGGHGGTAAQQENISACCEIVADLVQAGYRIVLTHGNGPQVGSILLQNDLAKAVVPKSPLDVCNAQTQGSLGYLLAQTLTNALQKRSLQKEVATVLAQVVVDARDAGFQNPVKCIGPFFTAAQAQALRQKYGFRMREDSGRGYRRAVPSPQPLELVEREAILALVRAGFLVITLGGGGIPVIREGGSLRGVEAVIDKDFSSGLIAQEIGADVLVLLTSVPKVAVNYQKPGMRELDSMTTAECAQYQRQGQFAAGSMGPKVEAARRFVANGGRQAIITSIGHMRLALEGKSGTHIWAGAGPSLASKGCVI